jgi:hypothetical protein
LVFAMFWSFMFSISKEDAVKAPQDTLQTPEVI